MPNTVIQLKTALAYYEAGRPEAAAALCESVLRGNPGDEAALELLEMISGAEGVGDEAAIGEALALNQAGNYGDAISILIDVLKTRPRDPQILCALGSAHFHLKQFNKAQLLIERALTLDLYSAEAYAVLGNCRINQGDVYGAL